MKQETPSLRLFIRDYKLEKPGSIICFTASVHFQAEETWYKFISDVNIITISYKHLDVIYLLNPEIDKKEIKTMFTNNHRFLYPKNRRFEITGRSRLYGKYSIFIIPIRSVCTQDTIFELSAKQNN
ncbi:MAG: hypothetical protein ABI741_06205 [Ferruginibacter sp.]